MAKGIERVLALDIGTTRVKSAACTRGHKLVGFHQVSSVTSPEGLLDQVRSIIQAYHPDSFDAVAMTGRMGHAVVTWPSGKVHLSQEPLMEAVTINRLRQLGVESRTGYPAHSPRFRAWWMESVSEKGAVIAVTPLKDWIIEQLGGTRGTDPSNAGALGLMDLRTGKWDENLLQAINLAPSVLPPIQSPHLAVGVLRGPGRLSTGATIYRGAGDGVAGPFGTGGIADGHAYINLGTHAVLRVFCRDWRDGTGEFVYPTGVGGYLTGVIRKDAGRIMEARGALFRPSPGRGLIFDEELGDAAEPREYVLKTPSSDSTRLPTHKLGLKSLRFIVAMVEDMVDAMGGPQAFGSIHLLGGGAMFPGVAEALRDALGVEMLVADAAATLTGVTRLVVCHTN